MAATEDSKAPVLELDEAIALYYDLLNQSKGMMEQVRLLRDRILRTLASKKVEQMQVDGYEVVRQLRHHPPQLNHELASDILEQHGRLAECQVEVLDEPKAREVIEELFHHGDISKDDLPYVYVKPTEALVVNRAQPEVERATEQRRLRRAA